MSTIQFQVINGIMENYFIQFQGINVCMAGSGSTIFEYCMSASIWRILKLGSHVLFPVIEISWPLINPGIIHELLISLIFI